MFVYNSGSDMRDDKHIAIKLRKKGKSYKEIEKELGIARSTLSDWFAGLGWSKTIKNDLIRKANYINHSRFRKIVKQRSEMWERWREQARQEARDAFPRIKNDPLFIAGIMLYWGEGDSKLENCHVTLINTDKNMIRLFVLFLKKFCSVSGERLRGQMILYNDLNEKPCALFWSTASHIPIEQFHKTQFIKGRHPTKRLTYGIFQVRLGSRQVKEKIAVWIDQFQNEYQF